MNWVILVTTVVIFLYFKVARSGFGIATAKPIPLAWKWIVLAALLTSAFCTCWLRERSFYNPDLPRRSPLWLVAELVLMFTFALVAADRPTLFYSGSLSLVAIWRGTDQYFAWRHRRARRKASSSRTNRGAVEGNRPDPRDARPGG